MFHIYLMTVWCDGRYTAYTHAYNQSTHIPNLEGRGPWGVPRTAHTLQSALPDW